MFERHKRSLSEEGIELRRRTSSQCDAEQRRPYSSLSGEQTELRRHTWFQYDAKQSRLFSSLSEKGFEQHKYSPCDIKQRKCNLSLSEDGIGHQGVATWRRIRTSSLCEVVKETVVNSFVSMEKDLGN